MIHRIRLIKHPLPLPNRFPDVGFASAHSIQCPQNTGHVFWHERVGKRLFDLQGQALFVLRVRPSIETELKGRGVYSVVRTLLEHQKRDLHAVENLCGLAQCINVNHWAGAPRLPKYRFDLRLGVVRVADGLVPDEPVVVRARDLAGVVHVARAVPGHPVGTMCGAVFDVATSVIVLDAVTCTGGC